MSVIEVIEPSELFKRTAASMVVAANTFRRIHRPMVIWSGVCGVLPCMMHIFSEKILIRCVMLTGK
jgi:hypothetical protein